MEQKQYILIATPAYNGYIHVEYLHTLLALKTAGIAFAVQTIANESLITRARNTLIASFWAKEQFTHLLFLDADVFLDVNGLKNMLYYKKDVIGAPVALKEMGKMGKPKLNTDANPDLDVKLQSVSKVGTAVFMLSRKAVGALIEEAVKDNRTYSKVSGDDGSVETHYDIFQVGIVDDHYLSEDFWVCHRLKQLGYEIYVDTSVYTRHSGIVAFE